MTFLASLPMYDWPEVAEATAAFWGHIRHCVRAVGLDAPEELCEPVDPLVHWRDARLLFSQTCGYPFVTALTDHVQLLGRPKYAIEGCGAGTYRSVILGKSGDGGTLADKTGRHFAFNSADSLSGYRCLVPMVGDLNAHFGAMTVSGAHRESARMVAEGVADCAAIDAVCWDMIQRYEPETAEKVDVIGWAPKFPSLPFITSASATREEVAALKEALRDAMNLVAHDVNCHPLKLEAIVDASGDDYESLLLLER